MNNVHVSTRRTLLKLGGAGVAALATTGRFSGQEVPPETANFGFVIEPDFVARLDETTRVVSHVSPLIVPDDSASFLPALLSNHQPTPDEAEAWFKSRFSSCCAGTPTDLDPSNDLDARATVNFLGEAYTADVVTHFVQRQKTLLLPDGTIMNTTPVLPQDEVALNIYTATSGTADLNVVQDRVGYRIAPENYPLDTTSTASPRALQYGQNIFTSPVLRVFLAYPEIHPLVPCEYRNVLHVKFDGFLWPDCGGPWWNCQWRSGGTQIFSLHVGTVPGMTCIVVYDSMHKWICINSCSGPSVRLDFAGVRNRVQQALSSSPIPGWLVPTLAYIIATLVIAAGVVTVAAV